MQHLHGIVTHQSVGLSTLQVGMIFQVGMKFEQIGNGMHCSRSLFAVPTALHGDLLTDC